MHAKAAAQQNDELVAHVVSGAEQRGADRD